MFYSLIEKPSYEHKSAPEESTVITFGPFKHINLVRFSLYGLGNMIAGKLNSVKITQLSSFCKVRWYTIHLLQLPFPEDLLCQSPAGVRYIAHT
jgi:hypothetical protein